MAHRVSTGENGKDGAPGQAGRTASAATTALPGRLARTATRTRRLDGKDGAPGQQGERGNDGTNGRDGAPGQVGKDGATGPQGQQGNPGHDGAPGKDGAPGQQGPKVRRRSRSAGPGHQHHDRPDVRQQPEQADRLGRVHERQRDDGAGLHSAGRLSCSTRCGLRTVARPGATSGANAPEVAPFVGRRRVRPCQRCEARLLHRCFRARCGSCQASRRGSRAPTGVPRPSLS